MFSYTSEYFKDLTTFYDSLNFNLTNLAISPLKAYCLGNQDQFKEIKKRYLKFQDDFEIIDLKHSIQKKSSVSILIFEWIYMFNDLSFGLASKRQESL